MPTQLACVSLTASSVEELVRQVNVLLGHYKSDDMADYELLGPVQMLTHDGEVHAILSVRATSTAAGHDG